MNDVMKEFEVNGKKYKAVFTLNVMQDIQKKYGTFDKWGKLVEGKGKDNEVDIEAVIYGIGLMFNEAIDIENEELEVKKELLTEKQVGRILTTIGIQNATKEMTNLIVESTVDTSKNV